MTVRPDDFDHLYVTEENRVPVLVSYVRSWDDVLQQALAAERLGLGWSAQGYHCPTGDEDETVREYRISVWRELMSETLPWSPDPEDTP